MAGRHCLLCPVKKSPGTGILTGDKGSIMGFVIAILELLYVAMLSNASDNEQPKQKDISSFK